jgi:hypothetical protein
LHESSHSHTFPLRSYTPPYPLSDEIHPEQLPTGTVVCTPLSQPLQVVA